MHRSLPASHPALVSIYDDALPASEIAHRHWQGGYPRHGELLKPAGFDAIIFSADEIPIDKHLFPNLHIVLAPMEDSEITRHEIRQAGYAAELALDFIKQKKRVLVTCAKGRNRSGLISALMLIQRFGLTGKEAVRQIQTRRANTLTNDSFVDFLEKINPQKGVSRANHSY